MDRVSSSTAGTICTLTTPEASKAGNALAPERAKDGGAPASVETSCFADASATAGSAEIPEPPAAPPDRGWEQELLDKSFAALDKLRELYNSIDPTTSEGQKRMQDIVWQLQSAQKIQDMITETRKARHDQIMKTIGTISSGA